MTQTLTEANIYNNNINIKMNNNTNINNSTNNSTNNSPINNNADSPESRNSGSNNSNDNNNNTVITTNNTESIVSTDNIDNKELVVSNTDNTVSTETNTNPETIDKTQAKIGEALDKYHQEKENPYKNHHDDLEANRDEMFSAGMVIGDTIMDNASDLDDEEDQEKVKNMWTETMEKYESLTDVAMQIEDLHGEDKSRSSKNPIIEKEILKTDNAFCKDLIECVSTTDRIFRKNDFDVDNQYNNSIRKLDVLSDERMEKSREYIKHLNHDIKQEQQIIQNILENQEQEAQDNKEEKVEESKKRKLEEEIEDLDIEEYQDNKKQKIEESKKRKLEEDSDTEENPYNKLQKFDIEKNQASNKASGSIIDDYADPSTEPGDWTGGDD